MKPLNALHASFALLLLSGCAPSIQGGPPIALPAAIQETAQISSVTLSTGWIESSGDFAETFSDEVREELSRCMWGTAPIDLRVHIDGMDRAGRLETLLNGEGEHELAGTVEFVDPARPDRVLGRYPIRVATGARGRIGGLIGDRQMMVSEAFGRAICDQAFGRNPRAPGAHNATPGG